MLVLWVFGVDVTDVFALVHAVVAHSVHSSAGCSKANGSGVFVVVLRLVQPCSADAGVGRVAAGGVAALTAVVHVAPVELDVAPAAATAVPVLVPVRAVIAEPEPEPGLGPELVAAVLVPVAVPAAGVAVAVLVLVLAPVAVVVAVAVDAACAEGSGYRQLRTLPDTRGISFETPPTWEDFPQY